MTSPFPDVSIADATAAVPRELELLATDGIPVEISEELAAAVTPAPVVEYPDAPGLGSMVLVNLGGVWRPAIVTEVHDVDGQLQICGVIFDHRVPHGTMGVDHIPYGGGPGAWRWTPP